jgi:hypothetical protein
VDGFTDRWADRRMYGQIHENGQSIKSVALLFIRYTFGTSAFCGSYLVQKMCGVSFSKLKWKLRNLM